MTVQVFDSMHLRALAGLPQLTVLNLYFLHWAESVTSTGLTLLANSLPRLQVLNAPEHVLVRPHCWTTYSWASHSGKSCTFTVDYIWVVTAALACGPVCMHVWLPGTSRSLRMLSSGLRFVTTRQRCQAVTLLNLRMSRCGWQVQHLAANVEAPTRNAVCGYELRDPPERRLQRWPRRATLDGVDATHHARKLLTCSRAPPLCRTDAPFYAMNLWPVLEPHRWLWEG